MKDKSQRYEHESYGLISLTRRSGGRNVLFGSKVVHSETVAVQISEAVLERQLSHDFYYPQKVIAEFEMSEAQWARFVSSFGNGTGTPITIRYRNVGELKKMAFPEALNDTISQTEVEIDNTMQDLVARVDAALAKAEEIASKGGTISKKSFAELEHDLQIIKSHLASNVNFVKKSVVKEVETLVEDAKIEIEAFAQNVAVATGLDAIRNGFVSLPGQRKAEHDALPPADESAAE